MGVQAGTVRPRVVFVTIKNSWSRQVKRSSYLKMGPCMQNKYILNAHFEKQRKVDIHPTGSLVLGMRHSAGLPQ